MSKRNAPGLLEHLLLVRVSRHQAVYLDLLLLANAVASRLGLREMTSFA
jgi:hypothetical protein